MVQAWISMDYAESADSEKPAPFGKEGTRTWPLGRCVSSSVVKVSGVLRVFDHVCLTTTNDSLPRILPLCKDLPSIVAKAKFTMFTPESPWQDRMALAGACGE